jgi:sugar phosphate isomerase/epimerase
MYKALAPGCIGHGKLFKEAAEAASKAGFEGYWFGLEGDSSVPVNETIELLEKYKLRAAGFNLPVEFRRDEAAFENGMSKFEDYVKYASKIGANRCATWIISFSETLEYKDNFDLHRSRLKKVAELLKEYGMIFGIEFLGPPKIRRGRKYDFIHSLDKMLELCDAIGTGNCGILMDVWHWDMAGQVRADFGLFKSPDQIALVHINDAPKGIPVEEQEDSVRGLPGETGVLRIAEFFDGLKSVGYEGPVLAEPFDKKLGEMTFEQALETTMNAINRVWPK